MGRHFWSHCKCLSTDALAIPAGRRCGLRAPAGLQRGEVATVVLTIEVLPDGTVGSVEVARGFGDASVDAEAVAYGRRLRWTPGTREHHAEVMRINFPVTLVWSA
jgi:TonB family protein